MWPDKGTQPTHPAHTAAHLLSVLPYPAVPIQFPEGVFSQHQLREREQFFPGKEAAAGRPQHKAGCSTALRPTSRWTMKTNPSASSELGLSRSDSPCWPKLSLPLTKIVTLGLSQGYMGSNPRKKRGKRPMGPPSVPWGQHRSSSASHAAQCTSVRPGQTTTAQSQGQTLKKGRISI